MVRQRVSNAKRGKDKRGEGEREEKERTEGSIYSPPQWVDCRHR